MRPSFPLTRALVWFAILVSPFQAVQGMHSLCSCCISRSMDHPNGDDLQEHSCCRSCLANSEQRRVDSRNDFFQPHTTCPCPPTCRCHVPAQPQLAENRDVESDYPANSLFRSETVNTATLKRVKLPALNLNSPCSSTAQQLCVALCRFLA